MGELAALGTACCWAVTSIVFAEAARRVGALRVNLIRLPMALVLLSAVVALREAPLAHLTPLRAAYLAVSAAVGLIAGDLAFFASLRRLGPRLAALTMSLAPIFAFAVGVPVLGEIPDLRAGLGAALALAGVAWVVAERSDGVAMAGRGRGVLLGVVGAACQGVGLVLAKLGMGGEVDPLAATWVRIGVASAGIWLLAGAAGRLAGAGLASAVRSAGWWLAAGAFFGPFLGVWLSLVATRLTAVGVAATIMATTPVILIPVVAVTERYRPSLRAIVGTIAAVTGVALLFR